MDTHPNLGQSVDETLKRYKFSRNQMSKEAGIPYATLTRKLDGHSEFTIRELGKIAKALDLKLKDVIPAEILEAA